MTLSPREKGLIIDDVVQSISYPCNRFIAPLPLVVHGVEGRIRGRRHGRDVPNDVFGTDGELWSDR